MAFFLNSVITFFLVNIPRDPNNRPLDLIKEFSEMTGFKMNL